MGAFGDFVKLVQRNPGTTTLAVAVVVIIVTYILYLNQCKQHRILNAKIAMREDFLSMGMWEYFKAVLGTAELPYEDWVNAMWPSIAVKLGSYETSYAVWNETSRWNPARIKQLKQGQQSNWFCSRAEMIGGRGLSIVDDVGSRAGGQVQEYFKQKFDKGVDASVRAAFGE